MKKFLLLILTIFSIKALVVGSETTPSIQNTSVSFPQADSDNEVLGFIELQDGFSLENAMTTCTFDGLFPVSGDVCLNRGTLFLEQDLILTDTGKFISGGKIEGFDKKIELPTGVSNVFLPTEPIRTFSLIDRFTDIASVNTLDWSFNSSYVLAGLSANASDELVLFYFDGNTLTETAQAAGTVDVISVDWHPSDNFFMVSRVAGADIEFQLYSFDPDLVTASVLQNVNIAADIPCIKWYPTGGFIVLTLNFAGFEIIPGTFSGSAITLNVGGIPALATSRFVQQDACSWAPLGNNYLATGMAFASATDPELLICSFDQAAVSLTVTVSANVGADLTAVDWSPTGSFIAVGLGAGVSERLRIYEHDVSSGTLLEVQSARVGEDASVFSVNWSNDGQTLAVGLEANSDTELRLYEFDSDNGTLSLKTEFESNITTSIVKFSPDGNYIATGDDNFNVSVYDFSAENVFTDLNLVLNSNISIRGPIVIEGDCTISGKGFTMGLDSEGSFSISPGAVLTLDDLTVTGLMDDNIVCGSDNSSIVIKNTKLLLSNNFTFSQGSILFQGDSSITGSNTFLYTSGVGSTIDTNSELLIDLGSTFTYEPSVASNNLIIMADETSKLRLRGCNFHVSSTGLQLTSGRVVLEGAPILSSDASNIAESIIFGDGIDSSNNLTVDVFPEVPLEVASGFLDVREA